MPQREGARAQLALVLTPWELRGVGIHEDGTGEPLAANPASGIFLGAQAFCGQPSQPDARNESQPFTVGPL